MKYIGTIVLILACSFASYHIGESHGYILGITEGKTLGADALSARLNWLYHSCDGNVNEVQVPRDCTIDFRALEVIIRETQDYVELTGNG